MVARGSSVGSRDLFRLPRDIAFRIAWSRTGDKLFYAGQSFGAGAWDVKRRTFDRQRYPHLARVRAISGASQGSMLATGSLDGTACIWLPQDASIEIQESHQSLQDPFHSAVLHGAAIRHTEEVVHVAFNRSGSRLSNNGSWPSGKCMRGSSRQSLQSKVC